jgi:hypothetical protein
MLNFPASAYGAIALFCNGHPGWPYQVIVQVRSCPRPLVEKVPRINY